MRRRLARDAGSATVWAAVAAMTLCVVFAAVVTLAQAVLARHRAGAAADLAALAAADRAWQGEDRACRAAEEVARAQRARVVRCQVDGEVSDVQVTARAARLTSRVRSRAGPQEAPSAAPWGGTTPRTPRTPRTP